MIGSNVCYEMSNTENWLGIFVKVHHVRGEKVLHICSKVQYRKQEKKSVSVEIDQTVEIVSVIDIAAPFWIHGSNTMFSRVSRCSGGSEFGGFHYLECIL